MLSPNAQEFIPQTGPVHQQQQMHQHHHPHPAATAMPVTTYALPTSNGTVFIYSGNASPIVPAPAAYTQAAMFNYLNNYFYPNASYNQENVATPVDSNATNVQNEAKSQQQQQQQQQSQQVQHVSYPQAPPTIIYNAHLTQASAVTAAYPYTYQLSPVVPATPYMPPPAALINYNLQPQPQQLVKNNMNNKYYGQNVNPTAPQQHQMYQNGPVYNKNVNNNATNKKGYGGKFNKNNQNTPTGDMQANRMNKFNKKRQTNGENVELDEKDWPSLNVDESGGNKTDGNVAASSVVIDDMTRKMSSFKSVNLIKYAAHQHYMNENKSSSGEHRSYGDASKQDSKLSFKEAVLTKPPAVVSQSSTPQTQRATTKAGGEQVNKKLESGEQNKVNEEQQAARRKSNRKRRGGTRKSSTRQKTDGEDETDEEGEEFDLNKEDFPGLADASDSAFNPSTSGNTWLFETCSYKIIQISCVIDAIHSKNAQNSDKQVKTVNSGGGKKSRQPITYEFATMISALEKGEQKDKPNKYKDKFSLNSMNSRHMQNRVRPQLNSTGSNLKTTTLVKKGKERETPKKKKPSTLKKVTQFLIVFDELN